MMNGFLILGVAALAAYMGASWERVRRAASDVRAARQRVSSLRQAAGQQRLQTLLIIGGTLLVIILIAGHS
jgi:hypothetical protein